MTIERVACPPQLAVILDRLFNEYVNALVVGTAALGLKGEWGYDGQTKTFIKSGDDVSEPEVKVEEQPGQ